MMPRLLEQLETNAQARGEAPAVRAVGASSGIAYTRRQLSQSVQDVARFLQQRLSSSGVVLLCHPNRPPYVPLFLGTLAARKLLFPISFDSTEPELAGAARRSCASAAIVSGDSLAALAPLFARSEPLPDMDGSPVLLHEPKWIPGERPGPALLLQSSGTTAQPKIVHRDAPSLDAVTANMVRACGFRENDHVLAAVPLCHSYGLEHGLFAPISAGGCIHVCEKFDLPDVLAELREHEITLFPGVPFMFDMLAQTASTPFPNLRLAYSAGGPLPRSTFDAFSDRFGLRLGQVYGATEIGSVSFNDPADRNFEPTSVGGPMAGVSITILDPDNPAQVQSSGAEGLIAVKAPSMMSGYLECDEITLLDGYFLTGDLGVLNEFGALTITGRQKLLIDIGGRKVNPLEVESILSQHPDIGACVVVSMQVSPTVQRVKAVLMPARPDVEISVQDVRRFARQRLSGYKIPRVFEVRASLPRSPAGKVLRRLVETT